MNGLLLFAGLVVLTAAFLSYGHPVLRRVGVLCIGLTAFAAGFLPTRNVWIGMTAVLLWLLLPWVEILLRVRKLRLPLRKQLQNVPPPSREMFPLLGELTDEIESCGFEHVADLGWEMDGYRQFLRLFADPQRRAEASVVLVEQHQLGFHFSSITSRGTDGSVFVTWNCPLSSSLMTPPSVRVNRVAAEAPFDAMVASHGEFLQNAGVRAEALAPLDPGTVRAAVEGDMEAQMQHNPRGGVLRPADDGHGRYSWRGMPYLWAQFLRDMFRFS